MSCAVIISLTGVPALGGRDIKLFRSATAVAAWLGLAECDDRHGAGALKEILPVGGHTLSSVGVRHMILY